MVIRGIESYQTLQVRTSHDQRSYEVDCLWIKCFGTIVLNIWHLELMDILGQDPPFTQRPPQELDPDTGLELVLFDLGWRVMAVEMYLVVPTPRQTFSSASPLPYTYSRGRTALSHALLVKARLCKSL